MMAMDENLEMTIRKMRRGGYELLVMLASGACRAALRRRGITFKTVCGDVYVPKKSYKRANRALDAWEVNR